MKYIYNYILQLFLFNIFRDYSGFFILIFQMT